MKVCPDCERSEREVWPVFTANQWCCQARSVAEAVGRSGKGYDKAQVQAVLVARVLGRANEAEAAAFMARLEQLGVEVRSE
jgi:hypothetical protein